jgi:membrane protein YdbS with pleckstrin-like domain
MPRLNTRLRQPVAALVYSSLGAAALAIFILVVGIIFIVGATSACVGDECGFLNPAILVPVIIVVGFIIALYPILYWYLFSYEISEHTITVNSGILFRQYETIDFGRVQTMDNERGPLLWFFGLTMVEIWTASADQISFTVGNKSAEARPRPDTVLILEKDDAQALKDFIMRSKNPPGL